MVEIRSLFSGWIIVDKTKAKEYIEYLMINLPGITGKKEKIKYINENRLRGITAEDLLKGE